MIGWQKTTSFFRGLQPVPNEEVFKIYEGTHLAITKINPSNFLNVGVSSVCLMFYSAIGCLYNKLFYSCIFLIGFYLWSAGGQTYEWCINYSFSLLYKTDSLVTDHISDILGHHLVCHFFALSTFWRHLWSFTQQTHSKMESTC